MAVELEYKILDVNPELIAHVMSDIGATQVYDDMRTITYFDYSDYSLYRSGEGVKLTEEGKLKLEHTRKSPDGQSDTARIFVSRREEAVEFLKRLQLMPVSEVQARRISYELGAVDFDIGCFPGIPPFMEVDMEQAEFGLGEMLGKLGLAKNEVIVATTPEVFGHYGKDYFHDFKVA